MSGIVVGVDESTGAAHALRWAAREGRLRRLPVTAVLAWGYLDQHHATVDAGFDAGYAEADAVAALDAIVESTLAPSAAELVDRRAVCGLAAAVLLEAAAGADLLVVGARGLGGFRELLVGSVSQHCLHHATVPVAVVRGAVVVEPTGRERIVVGVDGSPAAQHALAWALDEARARRAALEVVHAWSVPPIVSPYAPSGGIGPILEEAAQRIVDDAVSRANVDGLPVPVTCTVRCGGAAGVLLDAGRGADLIVVGSRGRGGFEGLLLGSVTHQVTHHAACPVVVLPAPAG
jgi:nucleotide-binding universal stress UspA family protein